MFKSRFAAFLLIISYVITLGHNLIPHHHHHLDQENSTHGSHHHYPADEGDHEHDSNSFLCIFSNIFHHDEDGLFVHSTSANEQNVSDNNAFGFFTENSIFESFTALNGKKHPPENHSRFKLYHLYSNGLRAPPASIA